MPPPLPPFPSLPALPTCSSVLVQGSAFSLQSTPGLIQPTSPTVAIVHTDYLSVLLHPQPNPGKPQPVPPLALLCCCDLSIPPNLAFLSYHGDEMKWSWKARAQSWWHLVFKKGGWNLKIHRQQIRQLGYNRKGTDTEYLLHWLRDHGQVYLTFWASVSALIKKR